MLVQPVAEPLQPAGLTLVHPLVALGVVADQHLGEVRVERLDVRAEVLLVLEVELLLPALLDRHRQPEPRGLRVAGDVGPELLVDQDAGGLRFDALVQGPFRALVDHALGIGDPRGLLLVRLPGHTEELLLERTSMIERQDVERLVVPERHLVTPSRAYVCSNGFVGSKISTGTGCAPLRNRPACEGEHTTNP